MAEIFFISDTHFGHKGILDFKNEDGKPIRNFIDIIEMHTVMIENWNRVVTSKDKIYHLGDVAFSKPGLELLRMLNGKKRLIRGNHDLYKTRLYMEHFQEIYGVRQIDGYWLTHVPMHPDCVNTKRVVANIHGHLHTKVINDPRWVNVSVEQIEYTPISFDEVKFLIGRASQWNRRPPKGWDPTHPDGCWMDDLKTAKVPDYSEGEER